MLSLVPKFKGTVYISTRMFVEQKLEPGALEHILGQLPEDDARVLREVAPMNWCDTEPVLAFHRIMQSEYGDANRDLCYEAGRFSASWNMNTVLKVFLRFRSPRWLATKAGSVWGRYHDTGHWTVESESDRRIVATLHDFAVTEPLFFRRLCGWLVGVCALTGGTNATVEHSLEGTAHRFLASW